MWRFFTKDGAEKRVAASVINPTAKMYTAAATSITNATVTLVPMTTTLFDTNNMANTGTGRITINNAGKYRITAGVAWTSNATGVRGVWVSKNGASIANLGTFQAVNGFDARTEGTQTLDLSAGDYLEVKAYQASGGALTLSATAELDNSVVGSAWLEVAKADGAIVSYVGVPGSLVGQELAYAQITAPVNVGSTTESAGTTVVTAPSFSVDGSTPVLAEFYAPEILLSGIAGEILTLCLFEGATEIGRILVASNTSGTQNQLVGAIGRLRFTPTVGAHTYTVTVFASSITGPPSIQAGSSGTGNLVPAFIRFTRAA